jgi:hypothetical protein
MRKHKNDRKKLTLAKETLAPLEAQMLGGAAGGACPQESNKICSIQHTCVSCLPSVETCA